MNAPTQEQVYSVIRSGGIAIGTVFTVLAAIGAVSPDSASGIVSGLQTVGDDLQSLIGDSWKLGTLLGPVLITLFARFGWTAASLKSQIAVVQAHPAAQVVVTDPNLAAGIPGVQVVTAPPTKP